MRKQEFLDTLKAKISILPSKDIQECLSFYSEMIDNQIDEGICEEDAISQIGSIDDIALQIIAEASSFKEATADKAKKSGRVWEIVLLALGSPIWISLLVSVFAVIISLFASLWAIIASIWSAFASFVACVPASALLGLGLIIVGNGASGFIMIAGALICAGLAIFSFFGCMAATKGALILTKNFFLWIIKCFQRKGGAR